MPQFLSSGLIKKRKEGKFGGRGGNRRGSRNIDTVLLSL